LKEISPTEVLLETDLPGAALHSRGKVRDLYEADGGLLCVATDRISAFDYVLATGIPCKGRVLTQLSLFWFDFLRDMVANHLVTADVGQYPEPFCRFGEQLAGRSMLVRRARMLPVECVVRGYLSGSGWREYGHGGSVCGIALPGGLRESARLPEPIFTPATKAESGHDINISFEETAGRIGRETAAKVRGLSIEIYRRAAAYAEQRGVIIADTKFEFGFVDDELVLADEVLTPDSSRFWPRDQYRPGGAPPSFDKQYVRDYLEQLGWNKQPPAPGLPADVTQRTSEKYREAYRRLAGQELKC
jgi:phosphoribosylaminoimidazole-succinocarboxamide synthase